MASLDGAMGRIAAGVRLTRALPLPGFGSAIASTEFAQFRKTADSFGLFIRSLVRSTGHQWAVAGDHSQGTELGPTGQWFRGEGSNPYMQDQNLLSYH